MIRRFRTFAVLLGLGIVATACPSPGPSTPATPVWTAHMAGGQPAPGDTRYASVIGNTSTWYAEFEYEVVNGVSSNSVKLYPRNGPRGDTLGAPQTLDTSAIGFGGGYMSDHVLLTQAVGAPVGEFEFSYESGGVWSHAGTFTPPDYETVRALTDSTLVTQPMSQDRINVYDLAVDDTGPGSPTVSASLGQTISIPAAWGVGFSGAFGTRVSVDGDVLAVTGNDYNPLLADQVGVFRRTGGVWQMEHSFPSPDDRFYGAALAIDDLGTTERIAIGAQPGGGEEGRLDVFTGSAGVWTAEATLHRPPGVADVGDGGFFGSLVGMDGNLIVVGYRNEPLDPVIPGDPVRNAYRMLAFTRTASKPWTFEASLDPVPVPVDTDGVSRGPLGILVAGTHVATTVFVGLPTPPGCMFCFNLRMEAWRFDRT